MAADFSQTFAALRTVMLETAPGMIVGKDEPTDFCLMAPWPHPRDPKQPMFFGMVRTGKAYVSYHLMPLYTGPALAAGVPEVLKRRMQGKTCFNFKAITDEQRAALEALTRVCAEAFAEPITL